MDDLKAGDEVIMVSEPRTGAAARTSARLAKISKVTRAGYAYIADRRFKRNEETGLWSEPPRKGDWMTSFGPAYLVEATPANKRRFKVAQAQLKRESK